MKCLVLAAGMSTRLGGANGGLPKPLMPVDGVPVLHRNLKWLNKYGIRDVIINQHYKGDEIRASVGDGTKFGLHVSWSPETTLLGTAGAAKKLESDLFASEPRVLIIYGDNVYGFDLTEMLRMHRSDRMLAGTIAVFDPESNIHSGIAGGRVITDERGKVTAFTEGQADGPGRVNAACYVIENEVMKQIPPPPQPSDWGKDIFPKLIASGANLRAFNINGYCLGIDTPEAYARAEELFKTKQVQ